ncbi:MAG: nucleoside recognition protein, partial [Clostridia bacterium]|nr:nucleoside recognition protein [Clostridia bacterium]
MDYLHFLYEAFFGSLNSIASIAVIVIPLMIFLQFIREFNILEKISVVLNPITKLLGISKYASL